MKPVRRCQSKWTSEEDTALMTAVNTIVPTRWSVIAMRVPGRTGKQCRERWVGRLAPDLNKGEWSIQEDHVLLSLHNLYGNKWSAIATAIPGRSQSAVKNRWNCMLRKMSSLVPSRPLPDANPNPILDEPENEDKDIFITGHEEEDLWQPEALWDL
jgi:hypothetical protein